MFRNYLVVALRNLRKNKIYTFINISGLALGLACFILISSYVRHQLTYDAFHEKADRIMRPVEIQTHPGVGTQHVAVTMGPLAPALMREFPEIESACRIWPVNNFFCRTGDKGFYEERVAFADPEIFDIFTISVIRGEAQGALHKPDNILLSETIANKYFGDEDPIGKTLNVSHGRGVSDYTVAAVFADYPENSHLSFELLISFSTIAEHLPWLKSWNTNSMATYTLLKSGVDREALEPKLNAYLETLGEDTDDFTLYLQPLRDIHLKSDEIVYQTYNQNQGSMTVIYAFSAIAFFVLLIACINFMNLATARSAKRAREVGVRKVLGSARRNLIAQFLGESLVITAIAAVFALILVQLGTPVLENLLDVEFQIESVADWTFLLQLLAITFAAGLAAGSYPAFFLSSYQPTQTLKGSFFVSAKGAVLRKTLVVLQFGIAITLIVCTGIIQDQLRFIQNRDLGFNSEQMIYVELRDKAVKEKFSLLKNEMQRLPGVVRVTAAAGRSGASGSQGTLTVAGSDGEQELMLRYSSVDFDFIDAMEMKVIRGRNFNPAIGSDSTAAALINESAVHELGWGDEAIGKEFEAGKDEPNLKVIGVIKDYHFYSLRRPIEPQIIYIDPDGYNNILVKIATAEIPATIERLQAVWQRHAEGRPFEYGFLDEQFARQYRDERRFSKLLGTFAGVAIFIACLGLFGLASFTAEQKTKEIGIRKVLGASISNIIVLLAREFARWVVYASLLAFPIAYFVAQDWLQNFVYRTEIQPTTFVLAAILSVAVAIITVSVQAARAALANPAKSLRYE